MRWLYGCSEAGCSGPRDHKGPHFGEVTKAPGVYETMIERNKALEAENRELAAKAAVLVEAVWQWFGCENCGNQRCMACVLRQVHDGCYDDCPDCSKSGLPLPQVLSDDLPAAAQALLNRLAQAERDLQSAREVWAAKELAFTEGFDVQAQRATQAEAREKGLVEERDRLRAALERAREMLKEATSCPAWGDDACPNCQDCLNDALAVIEGGGDGSRS